MLVEFSVGLVFTAYIVAIASLSPCPPLLSHWSGSWLIILAWILTECIFIRIRCLVATSLEKHGNNILFIVGIVSTLGQMMGGVIIFVLVDVYRLFKERPECVFDFGYSQNK